MTREYILQNLEVMCPIIFIDNPELRDYVMSTLQDSILIPKPKFQLGDTLIYNGYIIKADEVFYDLGTGRWLYNCIEEERAIDFYESELELVERKEDETN